MRREAFHPLRDGPAVSGNGDRIGWERGCGVIGLGGGCKRVTVWIW